MLLQTVLINESLSYYQKCILPTDFQLQIIYLCVFCKMGDKDPGQ